MCSLMGNQVPSNRESKAQSGDSERNDVTVVTSGYSLSSLTLAQSSEDLSVRGKCSSALYTYSLLLKEKSLLQCLCHLSKSHSTDSSNSIIVAI